MKCKCFKFYFTFEIKVYFPSSLIALIATPAHLLIHAIIQSGNHDTAEFCVLYNHANADIIVGSQWPLMSNGLTWVSLNLLISWDFHTYKWLCVCVGVIIRSKKKKNIQRTALLWMETPCWQDRSEESSQAGSSRQKSPYNLLLPRWWAEYHLWMHNTSNLEVNGLQQQEAMLVPLLSAKNINPGLQWAQIRQNWTVEDVWITAEATDGRVRIWHQRCKSMDPTCFMSTVQAAAAVAAGGVLVWGMFSWPRWSVMIWFVVDSWFGCHSLCEHCCWSGAV